ncbi:virulence protein RhuM/Fic/DOC family protein [Candidatus Parcubacteria bacterium]|nr:virulence protein RhuM/Fic/DOC family protein [Candidatus Parcubacteria bacterium]
MNKKEVVIYQTKTGSIELKGDIRKENIWANQKQISQLFGIDRTVVTKHINKIIRDKEIDEKSNVQNMHIANSDKPVKFYSLDVILAVGYRTNSKIAINFRKWATKTLKSHITEGYTLNKKVIARNYDKFIKSVEDVKRLLPSNSSLSTNDTLELIKFFAGTWFSLDAYDKSEFSKKGLTKKQVKITANDLNSAILDLKKNLLYKKEATDIFASERMKDSLKGIVGNVLQGFGGKDLYPTVEEKAAHLLYFVVKNHPFVDGNKRSGAFAFVWFLNKARILNKNEFTPEALTALTILVAESNPKDKERIVGLILNLLK